MINLVRVAHATSYLKYGAIGVKVRIALSGTVFPGSKMKPIEIPKSILNS